VLHCPAGIQHSLPGFLTLSTRLHLSVLRSQNTNCVSHRVAQHPVLPGVNHEAETKELRRAARHLSFVDIVDLLVPLPKSTLELQTVFVRRTGEV